VGFAVGKGFAEGKTAFADAYPVVINSTMYVLCKLYMARNLSLSYVFAEHVCGWIQERQD
jgi:hypothetical protein